MGESQGRLAYDIETNSIDFGPTWLDSLKYVTCLVVGDVDTREIFRFNDQRGDIEDGVRMLEQAEWRFAHNGAGFDEPALRHLYNYKPKRGRLIDTRALSEALYGNDLRAKDYAAEKKYAKQKKGWITPSNYGLHRLEAWGERLGDYKDDYKARCLAGEYGPKFAEDPFHAWHEDLEEYCVTDVKVLMSLVDRFKPHLGKPFAWIEGEVYRLTKRMEDYGFPFDVRACEELYATLAGERDALKTEVRDTFFPPFFTANGRTKPKRSQKRKSKIAGLPKEEITAGSEYTKIKMVTFNPGSRDHIAARLKAQYGWKPTVFTDNGKPKVDEEVMVGLNYPPCKMLTRFLMVHKRCSQMSEGAQGWLKKVTNEGRIHARYQPNGTRTGRMSCSGPNLQQVPAGQSEYGPECRALFHPPKGYKQVGFDAEGLELRMLAHYLARYDEGAYGRAVADGRKEDESDVHNVTKRAAGLNKRDSAKTLIYALVYGSGDPNLGSIVYADMNDAQRKKFGRPTFNKMRKLGAALRSRVMKNIPGLEKVKEAVAKNTKAKGSLVGIDKRTMRKATPHNGLNTLLQGSGGQIMKLAFVLLDWKLEDEGYVPGVDWEFLGMIHDEGQLAVLDRDNLPETIGKHAAWSIRAAGEFLGVRCRLDASYDIGDNWRDTH